MFALIIDGQSRVFDIANEKFDVAAPFEWVNCPGNATTEWEYAGGSVGPIELSFDENKSSVLRLVDEKTAAILAVGSPASNGLHVALDDSARADMGSMATTALAAIGGAVAWPDSYKAGWISIENTRIPLAAPTDGLSLAAAVGDYYAKVRQNGRTLKDAITAATTQAKLDAIEIDKGWPV